MSLSSESIESEGNGDLASPSQLAPNESTKRLTEPKASQRDSSSRETSTSIQQDEDQDVSPDDPQNGEEIGESQEATRQAIIE